jgi:sugar/nucleoside kinase (ribokinase family)
MRLYTTYDVITVGGATEDINFHVNNYHLIDNNQNAAGNKLFAFDYGTKVNIEKVDMSFGGGAANAAVSFASLGLRTACLTACGDDDRGRKIIANFKARGVSTDLVQKVSKEISGFSFIVIGAKNEHVAFSHRAANSKLSITSSIISKLARAKWLFVTSFSGSWKADFDQLFSLADRLKIAWNPGEDQLADGFSGLSKYLKQTTVLTFNKDEAVKLVVSHRDYKYKSYDFLVDSQNLLRAIHAWGPKIVVITNGEKGADAYDGQNFYHQNIIKPKAKADTTGLGDAFGSAFIASLQLLGHDITTALAVAAHNSSSVLAKQGAQNGVLTKADFARLTKT